jgi:hypothetical protein
MPFYLWSRTPASNATADPTINYAEGQAPSSLNDSARAADPGHVHNLQGGTTAGFANPTVVEANGAAGTLTGGAQSNTTGITLSAAATGITNVAAATGITNVAAATGISTNNNGSGTAHTILPPAMVLPYILRII